MQGHRQLTSLVGRPEGLSPRLNDPDPLTLRLFPMSKMTVFILFLLLAAVAGGGLFIVTWEIPPPTTQVEKTIPDDKFPR